MMDLKAESKKWGRVKQTEIDNYARQYSSSAPNALPVSRAMTAMIQDREKLVADAIATCQQYGRECAEESRRMLVAEAEKRLEKDARPKPAGAGK